MDEDLLWRCRAHRLTVTSIAFADSDQILVSSSCYEDTTYTWSADKGFWLRTFQTDWVVEVAGSNHHPFFVAACQNPHALLCNAAKGGFRRFPLDAEATAFTADGQACVSIHSDKEGPRVWSLEPAFQQQESERNGEVLEEDLPRSLTGQGGIQAGYNSPRSIVMVAHSPNRPTLTAYQYPRMVG